MASARALLTRVVPPLTSCLSYNTDQVIIICLRNTDEIFNCRNCHRVDRVNLPHFGDTFMPVMHADTTCYKMQLSSQPATHNLKHPLSMHHDLACITSQTQINRQTDRTLHAARPRRACDERPCRNINTVASNQLRCRVSTYNRSVSIVRKHSTYILI